MKPNMKPITTRFLCETLEASGALPVVRISAEIEFCKIKKIASVNTGNIMFMIAEAVAENVVLHERPIENQGENQ